MLEDGDEKPRGHSRDEERPRGRGGSGRQFGSGSGRGPGDRDRRGSRDFRGRDDRRGDGERGSAGREDRGFRGRDDRGARGRDERRSGPRDDRRSGGRDDRGFRGRDDRGFRGRDDRGPRDGQDRGRFDDRPRSRERDDREPREEIVGPEIPEGFDEKDLAFGVRAELRGISKGRADRAAAHIWAAGHLIDEDPALAFQHAETARQLAPRLPIVREAAAETAYAAGEYAIALREYRAIRRMSGGDELIPVIADCERALGRPRDALEVLEGLDMKQAPAPLAIEALIVEAGARADMGQRAEGLRLLKTAASRKVGPDYARARLLYAYADLLLAEGQENEARSVFISAGLLDPQGALDTADRVAELDGVTLPESLEQDPEPEPETEPESEPQDAHEEDDEA